MLVVSFIHSFNSTIIHTFNFKTIEIHQNITCKTLCCKIIQARTCNLSCIPVFLNPRSYRLKHISKTIQQEVVKMICPDFMEFQEILKKMRVLDDKIVCALNISLPTESFRKKVDTALVCQDLLTQIKEGHTERENIIKNCIVVTAEAVKKLREAKQSKPDDIDTLKDLKAEQRKLRLLQTELSVEEVIQDKTQKLFTEKCRTHYKPE